MRKISALSFLVLLVVIGVIIVKHKPAPVEAGSSPALTTASVRRTDLTDAKLMPGTLGFGTPHVVKGAGPGVLTKLPAVGAVMARGITIYRVDDQPVTVLYGSTPIFRTIDKPGLEGNDVLELRRNLTALGYRARSEHPEVADAALLAALKQWQTALDLPKPGALQVGQAVVLTGPGQVSAVTAEPGDPADGEILSITATTKVVSVSMSATDAGSVRTGSSVSITLPDGKQAAGTVTAVSRAVTDNAQAGDDTPKVVVTVTPAKAVTFDAAPVQVRFTTVTRKGVLAVPVGALVALREGGYAVQKPDGSLIAAKTGLFASGMVEVSGAGITDGLTVVTTQ